MKWLLSCSLLVAACGQVPTGPTNLRTESPAPAPLVWIISGQSNAVGCAEGSGPAPMSSVMVGGSPAVDPLPFFERPDVCQVGPWVTAAQAVSQRTGRTITLSGWGRLGVPISLWDGEGWEHLKPAIPLGATTFLWWQGEADVPSPSGYAGKLQTLIDRVRSQAQNPALVVVIIGLADAPYASLESGYTALRAEQAAFVARDPHAILVPAQGLPLSGNFHLFADGYAEVGRRVAEALRPIY